MKIFFRHVKKFNMFIPKQVSIKHDYSLGGKYFLELILDLFGKKKRLLYGLVEKLIAAIVPYFQGN